MTESLLKILKSKYKKENAVKISKLLEKYDEKVLYEKLGEIMQCDKKDINKILKGRFYEGFDSDLNNKVTSYIERPEVQEGNYQCNKCGSKKTYYYQLQTRSADEAMTTFVTCANTRCQAKWKE